MSMAVCWATAAPAAAAAAAHELANSAHTHTASDTAVFQQPGRMAGLLELQQQAKGQNGMTIVNKMG